MKVLIAGGGTAGHIFPAIALAEQLVSDGVEVGFAGTERGLETDLVPSAGFDLNVTGVIPFPRKLSPDLVRAPLALIHSVRESRPVVKGSDVVVGMGGYASAPAVLAAIRAKVPVVLHEQNAVPGAANRIFSRRARVVALSFEEASSGFPGDVRKVVTGNPVRSRVAAVVTNRDASRQDALDELDLLPERRTIVIFGGSQGAIHVNTVATEICHVLAEREDLQVLLLTGRDHLDTVRSNLPTGAAIRVRALSFLDPMELAYVVADLVVSRAGATSIAETTACGLPALLIPYPHATADHQQANARAIERSGGARVILDNELTAKTLVAAICEILDGPGVLDEMAARSRAWGRPDAARALAAIVEGEATK